MEYEIVTLEEKIIEGVSARTSNEAADMGAVIGGLWRKLYEEGEINRIKNRMNAYAVGLYSDYDADSYEVTAGCEVSKAEADGLTVKVIPAGRYARFRIQGDMIQAVAEAWGQIWQMDLKRTFTGDFEEYVDSNMENATIYIYIAIEG